MTNSSSFYRLKCSNRELTRLKTWS